MIGLMPASLALLIELERPVQIAVIGERQGIHPQLFGPIDQLLDRAGAVEQAVMAVAMQMYEGRHCAIRANSILVISEKCQHVF